MKKPQKGELELKFLMESKVSRIDSSFLSLFMIFLSCRSGTAWGRFNKEKNEGFEMTN